MGRLKIYLINININNNSKNIKLYEEILTKGIYSFKDKVTSIEEYLKNKNILNSINKSIDINPNIISNTNVDKINNLNYDLKKKNDCKYSIISRFKKDNTKEHINKDIKIDNNYYSNNTHRHNRLSTSNLFCLDNKITFKFENNNKNNFDDFDDLKGNEENINLSRKYIKSHNKCKINNNLKEKKGDQSLKKIIVFQTFIILKNKILKKNYL